MAAHIHSEEVWTFFAGGFGFTTLSYAVRSFPRPINKYGLWFLGVLQFILLNVEQGKNNFQAIQESKFVDAVGQKVDVENAKIVNKVLEGTGSGAVSEDDLPKKSGTGDGK